MNPAKVAPLISKLREMCQMKSINKLRVSAIAVAVGIALSPAVWAATQDDIEQLKQQVEELDQKIRVLERQQEIDKENAAAKAKATPSVAIDSKGFGIKSGDGANELRVNGYVQADSRWYTGGLSPQGVTAGVTSPIGSVAAATGGVDTFLIRRARLQFSGTLGKYFDFWLEPSFDNGEAGLQSAYITANVAPEFKVQVGKFKVPFGLERLQSSANNSFVETAFTTGLTPNYEVGAQLLGTLFSGTTDYQLAVINGSALENVNTNGVAGGGNNSGSEDADNNDAKGIVARLFVRPFQVTDIDALKKLGIGFAYLHDNDLVQATAYNNLVLPTTITNVNLGSYRSPGQQTFFAYNGANATAVINTNTTAAYAVGSRDRWSPQANWYYGPFGLLAEYVRSSQDIARNTISPVAAITRNIQSVDNHAWQVLGSWVITGEDEAFGTSYPGSTVVPKHPFDWRTGNWGAFEAVARYNEQDNDPDVYLAPGATTAAQIAALQLANPATAAQQARDIGLGLNWYFNRYVKLQTSYDVTNFSGGGGTLPGALPGTTIILDRPQEKVFFTRVQLAY